MGKSLQEYEIRSTNAREDQKSYHWESHEWFRHLDRLAVPLGRIYTVGQMQIYTAVHLPLRILYGAVSKERTGKKTKHLIVIQLFIYWREIVRLLLGSWGTFSDNFDSSCPTLTSLDHIWLDMTICDHDSPNVTLFNQVTTSGHMWPDY